MDLDDDDFLPDIVSSETENTLQNITTTEPEKTPEHDSTRPDDIPEPDITHEDFSPPPDEIAVPDDSPQPENITTSQTASSPRYIPYYSYI